MPADAGQLAHLRRLTAEPPDGAYPDAELAALIARFPLADAAGWAPTSAAWTPTYDLNAAAAEVWDAKAAALAQDFDFAADGGDYRRSQAHQHARDMARLYRAKRTARSVFLAAAAPPGREGSDGT